MLYAVTKIEVLNDTQLEITGVCPSCKKTWRLIVSKVDWSMWQNFGLSIQDAFEKLAPAERELLMTGICGPCYKAMAEQEEY